VYRVGSEVAGASAYTVARQLSKRAIHRIDSVTPPRDSRFGQHLQVPDRLEKGRVIKPEAHRWTLLVSLAVNLLIAILCHSGSIRSGPTCRISHFELLTDHPTK
jgi:hypothetical protein